MESSGKGQTKVRPLTKGSVGLGFQPRNGSPSSGLGGPAQFQQEGSGALFCCVRGEAQALPLSVHLTLASQMLDPKFGVLVPGVAAAPWMGVGARHRRSLARELGDLLACLSVHILSTTAQPPPSGLLPGSATAW